MALYVGEAVALIAEVKNPITKNPIADLTAEVELYEPGKDPKNVPADRTADATVGGAYDATNEVYVAYFDSAGREAGKWTYRFRVTGTSYDNFEYASFTLKP